METILGFLVVCGAIYWLIRAIFGESEKDKLKRLERERAEKLAYEREAANRRQAIREALLAKIVASTKNEEVRGFKIRSEYGWLKVEGCDSPRAVEEELKLKAAKMGANALLKMHWQSKKTSYKAGVGHRGNPYYREKTIYSGEALSVYIETQKTVAESTPKVLVGEGVLQKSEYSGIDHGWVAVDGNNLFGKLYEVSGNSDAAFRALNLFILRLKASPYKPHVFWDGKFISFARAIGLTAGNEKLDDILLSRLSLAKDELTVSDFGEKADSFIVAWAFQKGAAIVSGDRFSKASEDEIILQRSRSLAQRGLLLNYQVIAGDIVVPHLVKLP